MIYCNGSTCRDVTTQAEINEYANDGKTCVHIVGGSDLVISGNATVNGVWGNATVNDVWDNATVNGVWDNATVNRVSGNATVNGVWGNATVNGVWGNATVNRVSGNATVNGVWDNATVNDVWGNATVNRVSGNATVNDPRGAVVIRASGDARVNNAGPNVMIVVHGVRTKVVGGVVHQIPDIETPAQWCEFYGVEIVDGEQYKSELAGVSVVVLYKVLNDGFKAHWNGFLYLPGSEPQAPDWDGGERECGGGLHFSPTPHAALRFNGDATYYVACPILLDGLAIHPNGDYPDKVKASGVCAPIYEVDIDGNRIESNAEVES